MSRYLAIEWDQRHVRFAVVLSRRGQLRVEHTVTVQLPRTEDERATQTSRVIGSTLRAALAAHGVKDKRALVCVGREAVEIQRLTLPPCPVEELPDLVRHQAVRELSSVSDESVVDFVPIYADASQSCSVMVAAISSAGLQFIRGVCEVAQLTLRRLVLRPHATASRFLSATHRKQGTYLLVDVSGNEAELVVLRDGHVVFTRAILLPADNSESEGRDPLLPEIARTIMAVQNQADVGSVDQIFVSGDTNQHQALTDQITAELNVPAEVFDPFTGLIAEPSTDVERAGQPGRFIALLGTLIDESTNVAPSIDFLHPRKRPAPPNRRRQIAAGVAAAATAVTALAFFAYQGYSELKDRYDALKAEEAVCSETAKKADAMLQSVAEIEAWSDSDVIWLDELRELSQTFPNRRDAVLQRLSMQRAPGGGVTVLTGLVRAPSIVEHMEDNLRNDFHKVKSDNLQEKTLDETSVWQFVTTVTVAKRDVSKYMSPPPSLPVKDNTIRPNMTPPGGSRDALGNRDGNHGGQRSAADSPTTNSVQAK